MFENKTYAKFELGEQIIQISSTQTATGAPVVLALTNLGRVFQNTCIWSSTSEWVLVVLPEEKQYNPDGVF